MPDLSRERPPAATAGSPGTSIFLPPTPGSRIPTRAASARPAPQHPRPDHPRPDHIPVQWSFESTYGIFGAAGGAAVPARHDRDNNHRDTATSGGSGMGNWFGRRRDKDKDKDKSRTRTTRAKSVDAPRIPLPDPVSPRRPPSPLPTPPLDAASFSSSSPLPMIPASNAPTPRPSRAPSPVARPPPSFRPTAANRPGSSAGFKPHARPPVTRPRGIGSAPAAPITTPTTAPLAPSRPPRRRPATSSGLPQSSEVFLGNSLGTYGLASSSYSLSLSSVSLSPAPGSLDPLIPPEPERAPTPPPSPPRPSPADLRKAARLRGFVLKGGKRHHPRPPDAAPYPRDYERKVLDHDVWEHTFARQLAGAPSFHTFPSPPARILDLGCGTGTWVLDAARVWPAAHLVGLDLVPIQPDPAHLGLAPGRVRWVHANFLEPLPFPDAAFSFVHVRRVARGVPEDRWGALFEEAARVLEPGGVLEIVEEDLFFPGSEWVGEEEEEEGGEEGGVGGTHKHDSRDVLDRDHHHPASPPRRPPHSRSSSASSSASSAAPGPTATDPRDHTLLARAYTDMHAARFINLAPLAVLHSVLVQYFRDVRTHPALQLAFPPPPTPAAAPPAQRLAAPYITLDTLNTRAPPAFPLPRTVDAAALSMHLAARAAEVLACAEEMWAFLCAERGDKKVGREEWEECLARFEMDMHVRAGLGPLLAQRLKWRVRAAPRTPERRAFDDAVRRWERAGGRAGAGAEGGSGRGGVPLCRRIRVFVAGKA